MRSALTVVIGMVVVTFLRLLVDQVQGYRTAERYLESGDKKNAIMYFDRVLNAHIPFSPLERAALKRLLDTAADYERQGERELALVCYETARSSRYLARSAWVPDKGLMPDVDPKIATIKAEIAVMNGIEDSFEAAFEKQMKLMGQDQSPSVALSVVALISFFLHIGAMLLWALSSRRRYLCASIFLFASWLTTLFAA